MTDFKTDGVVAARPWAWEAARVLSRSHRVGIVVWTLAFSLLTAVGAHLSVPLGFTPVPITLQTLFVLLSGGLLGPVAGAASQLLYLALGVSGMPVFALGGGGWAWVLGPTGGYLLAFPLASAMVGWIAGDSRGLLRPVAGLVAGTLMVFWLGASWILAVTDGTPREVFVVAVAPFLTGAVLKAAIALVVMRGFRGGVR